MENKIDRKTLIGLCEQAIVPCEDWNDRDSYSAQVQVSDIYGLLNANAEYKLEVRNDSICIEFINLTENIISKAASSCLDYCSREDYYNLDWVDSDDEMFDSQGIDLRGSCVSGYLPTQERLDATDGADWY